MSAQNTRIAIENLNTSEPVNIQYKKLACAIEQDAEKDWSHNQARKVTWTEQQKREMLRALTGMENINPLLKKSPKGRYVAFPDGTKARF